MRTLLIVFLSLAPFVSHASCDFLAPEVRELVRSELKKKTDADLSKAFWLNSFKSDVYSVFIVQFKRHDNSAGEDKIYTFTVPVSCVNGAPFIDATLKWSIPLSSMQNI